MIIGLLVCKNVSLTLLLVWTTVSATELTDPVAVTKQKPTKPHVWLNGLLLNLNLTISNQIIRIQSLLPPDMRTGIQSAPSHHHSLSVACDLLIKTKDLSPRILSYASDTLLHFT
jgi:hypothetical protein